MKSVENLVKRLKESLAKINEDPKILQDCSGDEQTQKEYEEYRLVFNRKFHFRPSIIVFVQNTDQVSEIVKFTNQFPQEVILRLRSGGHDHEGECSGTDTLMMDFSKMDCVDITEDTVEIDGETFTKISIEPGARFKHIKQRLDHANLGIPHGTCETVAIAGFTMGGGWGPWTRRYGMACESLTGVTLVLGDGQIVELSDQDDPRSCNGRLLWALRGGGGMSYGVVTKLYFNAFTLPQEAFSFNIKF
ncbi:MAG: FAD-dependent oxidoreductase, partial [Flavobacteriales bacterium]|nr:FAD-dependent oxidoreductase [Flavobacteriales bacterium]